MAAPIGPGGGDGGQIQYGKLTIAPSGTVSAGNATVGGNNSVVVVASNIGNAALTIDTAVVTGAEWSIAPGTVASLLPGHSISFTITFTPTSVGAKTSTATFTWEDENGGGLVIKLALTGTALAPGGNLGVYIPAALSFDNTQVNRANTLVVVLKNIGANPFNVTALAFATGTQFSFSGTPPALPFTLAVGATRNITLQFNPTIVGLQSDSLTATTNIAGSIVLSLSGFCSLIVPVAVASGILNLVLGGYDLNRITGNPGPLQVSATSYNSDQAGTIVFNGALWEGLGQEKTILRLGFYYENLGVVTLTGTLTVFRPQGGVDALQAVAFSITYGTALADKTTRYAEVDVVATGEIITLALARAISAGAVSIIAIVPYFEQRGEKVRES